MDYNELKLSILSLLAKEGGLDSSLLIKELASSARITIDIHALRMALMRYYKLGLLKRERSGGTYRYTLTDRGTMRLQWLKEQAKNSGVVE